MLDLLRSLRERLLRKKVIDLLELRDYFYSKVTIDSSILDNGSFNLADLEKIWDENSSKAKECTTQILDVLDEMSKYNYDVSDLLNKYPVLNKIKMDNNPILQRDDKKM